MYFIAQHIFILHDPVVYGDYTHFVRYHIYAAERRIPPLRKPRTARLNASDPT